MKSHQHKNDSGIIVIKHKSQTILKKDKLKEKRRKKKTIKSV